MIVDVDLHHQIADWKAVAPYVPEGLRWRVLRPAGPPMARHGYKAVGVAPPRGKAVDPARLRVKSYEVAVEPGAAVIDPVAPTAGLVKGPYVAETYPVSREGEYLVVEIQP